MEPAFNCKRMSDVVLTKEDPVITAHFIALAGRPSSAADFTRTGLVGDALSSFFVLPRRGDKVVVG